MKRLRTSLLFGFLAEMLCAFIGVLGATSSDMLGRVAMAIHAPSMFVAGLVFSEGGRSTIYRDVAFVFVIQWAIYTLLIFAALLLVHRYKREHDNAAS